MMTFATVKDPKVLKKQELILATALRLFTDKGYFNTSIHDLQREAGISIGAIYHHFRSKEAIAAELFHRLLQAIDAQLEQIQDCHHSAHDRCRAALGWLMSLSHTSPATMQFVLYARHREFLPDEPPICSSVPFIRLKRMIADGMDNGEIRPMDLNVASAALLGGGIRLIQLQLDGVLDGPASDHLDLIWDCAWRSVAMEN
ncbi:TetR/AcrR family transcriptional regulator [Ferrimonas sediminum]|nr:TetR/AcrR family transcriptional regulator [Ferrimonas sediminum]